MNEKEKMAMLVRLLDAKKAGSIAVVDVEASTIIASYFVIASGTGLSQLSALADEAAEKMAAAGAPAVRTEGRGGGWILMDFGGVILHLFTTQMRDFYDLERLWSDAPHVDISGLLTDD